MAKMPSNRLIKKASSRTGTKEPGQADCSGAGLNRTATGDIGPPTVAIRTHGCKLNQSDSETIARSFTQAGYRMVDWADGADVMVLNTCTITATADAKARQALRGARRNSVGLTSNKSPLVVATGCYAQRAADQLAKVEGISLVVGNTGKDGLVETVTAALDQSQKQRLSRVFSTADSSTADSSAADSSTAAGTIVGEIPGNDRAPLNLETLNGSIPGRTRAMMKIQEGCDQVCAYCIVPKVRGRERSIHPDLLLEQIKQRIDQGCQEVVLTGTQLGTYGFDLGNTGFVGNNPNHNTLGKLLQRILKETSLTRLRVSSLQPQEINPDLLDLWSDPRLCPHFHLPLQSGCDDILKSMRRRYDTRLFAAKVDLIRNILPDAGITTDLIVGFPGEGDLSYRISRDFAYSMYFSDIHVFPYSPRPGTSAFLLKNRVADNDRKQRVGEMGDIGAEGFRRFRLSQLGSRRPVLWESRLPAKTYSETRKAPAGVWSGLTDNYIRVHAESAADLGNTVTEATLSNLVIAGGSVAVTIE